MAKSDGLASEDFELRGRKMVQSDIKMKNRLLLELGPHLILEGPQTRSMLCDEIVRTTRSSLVVDLDGALLEQTSAIKVAQGFRVLDVGAGADSIDPFAMLAGRPPHRRVELMTAALLGVEPRRLGCEMSLEWDIASFALLLTMYLEPERSVETLRALLEEPSRLGDRLESIERLGWLVLTEHTERVYHRMCSGPLDEVQRACAQVRMMCSGEWAGQTNCVFAGLHDPSFGPTIVYLRGPRSTTEQAPLRMYLAGLLENLETSECPGVVFIAGTHRVRRLYPLLPLLASSSDVHVLLSARSVSAFAVSMELGGERALSRLRGVVFTTPMRAVELENVCIRLGHEHNYLALRRLPEGQVVVLSGDTPEILSTSQHLRTP